MPRRKVIEEQLLIGVCEEINKGNFNQISMPNSENAHELVSNLENGIYRVEQIAGFGDIYIQKPDTKTERDFNVWLIVDHTNYIGWRPEHPEIFEAFWWLINEYPELQSEIFNAFRSVIVGYKEPDEILQEKSELKNLTVQLSGKPARKFNISLAPFEYLLKAEKWLAIEEDANYPPPKKLGRRYPYACLILLNSKDFTPKEVTTVFLRAFQWRRK